MKFRKGFVSNSSSSSFVLIDDNPNNKLRINAGGSNYIINVPQTFGGCYDFGRGHQNYGDFGSRINWAFLQAYSMDIFQASYGDVFKSTDAELFNEGFWTNHQLSEFHDLVERVRTCIYEELYLQHSIAYKIQVNFDLDYDDEMDYERWWRNNKPIDGNNKLIAHIDHQSMWSNKPENLNIFLSDDSLRNFLFGANSAVCERSDDLVDGTMILPKQEVDNDIPF